MDKARFKKRYEALQPLPETGWDTTWIDRVRTWEDFVQRGADVAVVLRRNQISAANYEGDIRSLAPELHDLLLEAFPITPEVQADLDEWKAELGFIEQ
jgi:hypothetical protein